MYSPQIVPAPEWGRYDRYGRATDSVTYPRTILLGVGDADGMDVGVSPRTSPHRYYGAAEPGDGATVALMNDVNQCLAHGYDVHYMGLKHEYGNTAFADTDGVVAASIDPSEFPAIVARVHAIVRERGASPVPFGGTPERPVLLAIDNLDLIRRAVLDGPATEMWDELAHQLSDIMRYGRSTRVHVVAAGPDRVPADALDSAVRDIFRHYTVYKTDIDGAVVRGHCRFGQGDSERTVQVFLASRFG